MGLLAEAHAWLGDEAQAQELLTRLEALSTREAARARRRVARARPEPVAVSER